jgi:hypothetical protein
MVGEAMSENTQQEPQILNLVRIKNWYVPGDDSTYKLLRSMKLPLLKINRDFLPVVKLKTGPLGIRARSREFSEILNERLDRVGAAWVAKKGRTCKLTDKRLSFSAPCTDQNRKAIAAIEASFAKFCLRWGHRYAPSYSEANDRLRLVLDYSFDPDRNPVIESGADEMKDAFEVELGFTKLKFTFMDKAPKTNGSRQQLPPVIHLEVMSKMGTEWKSAHTSTFVSQQIGDLSQMMVVLSKLQDRRAILAEDGAVDQEHPIPKSPQRPDVVEALRSVCFEVESAMQALVFTTEPKAVESYVNALVAVGRKIPRLNQKLTDLKIPAQLSRRQTVAFFNSPNALWPYFFDPVNQQQAIPMSPEVIDRACVTAFERLKKIRDVWLNAEFNDPVAAKELLLKAAL